MIAAIRIAVITTISIAFYFTRGLGSIVATFAMGLVAVGASHAVARLALRKRDVQLVVAVAFVVVGLAYLIPTWPASRSRGSIAYRSVEEVLADPPDGVVKIHGSVEALERRIMNQATEYRFALAEHGERVVVEYSGSVPDTFKEHADAVATGRLRDGVLVATEVSAKCPERYGSGAAGDVRYR